MVEQWLLDLLNQLFTEIVLILIATIIKKAWPT